MYDPGDLVIATIGGRHYAAVIVERMQNQEDGQWQYRLRYGSTGARQISKASAAKLTRSVHATIIPDKETP